MLSTIQYDEEHFLSVAPTSTPIHHDRQDPVVFKARVLDAAMAFTSIALMFYYIFWYYSYRWGRPTQVLAQNGEAYHRVDIVGQRAREIFVRAVCYPDTGDGNVEANIAIQAARNPITAQSILATGAVTGATTLVNILLDHNKMKALSELGRNDPLTGKSDLVNPKFKMLAAISTLLLSFFSLVQSLRLFVHMGFFVRAASYCSLHPEAFPEMFGFEESDQMYKMALETCKRAQTFLSLGLRFMYMFIPCICWLIGGTYMLGATVALVTSSFFVLDHV